MRTSLAGRNFVKLLIVVFAIFLAAYCLFVPTRGEFTASASASGPSASHTDAPGEDNCTSCHTSFTVNSGNGSVSLSGAPANYLPNQSIPITITTAQADAVIYGFQMTAIDSLGKFVGSYTIPAQNPAQMQTVTGTVLGQSRQYIEHTVDGIIPTQFGSKTWTFTWKAPSRRVGKVRFYVSGNAANSDGGTGGDYIYTKNAASLTGTAVSSFDGDGTSETAVWRPSNGVWFSLNSSNGGFQAVPFGQNGDKIVPGDYDGDGKTDWAVYRASNGAWYLLRSTAGFYAAGFGTTGDIPVQADFDGDLKTDLAVYRPTGGFWYLFQSTAGFEVRQFGNSTDKPMPADYDGDAKADLAVYRPSTGVWYLQQSTDGFSAVQFGIAEDKPMPGDYDGDGKSDIAVFRPSNGAWYMLRSRDGFYAAQFGTTTDIPSPADLDGDGKTDIAVFRPSEGNWYGLKSTNGSLFFAGFGTNGDVPVPSGYIP